MPRFTEYVLREQVGDALVLHDLNGHERRVGFKILNFKLFGMPQLYVVSLTSGAWLTLDRTGEFQPLTILPQKDEVDALTVFLSFLRRSHTLFDQTEQAVI